MILLDYANKSFLSARFLQQQSPLNSSSTSVTPFQFRLSPESDVQSLHHQTPYHFLNLILNHSLSGIISYSHQINSLNNKPFQYSPSIASSIFAVVTIFFMVDAIFLVVDAIFLVVVAIFFVVVVIFFIMTTIFFITTTIFFIMTTIFLTIVALCFIVIVLFFIVIALGVGMMIFLLIVT